MASPEKSSPEKDAPLHRRISEKLITTLGIKKTASSEPQQLVEEPVPLEDNEGKSQHDRRFEEKRHSQSGNEALTLVGERPDPEEDAEHERIHAHGGGGGHGEDGAIGVAPLRGDGRGERNEEFEKKKEKVYGREGDILKAAR